ncbi:heavy-metal-associated domain-containing protein [Sphingorhabdus sp.]|uniref:heavy-metal-associated domain-containing protein n=1 Tax=Sphingorhabdus sp. TaxID=1902408 RepID=UPI0032B85961
MRVRISKSLWKYALAVPLLVGSGVLVHAQIEGPKRGIPPIASNGDFEVTGVVVNATGKNAEEARRAGWEEAQRKAWSMLWAKTHGGSGSSLSDSTLDGIVSAIIVEEEQIGPRRYIAKLGVSFDRARAGQLLGVKGVGRKSAPLLVIPVMYSNGSPYVFERQTPWQAAWAKFRTSDSLIDYVRPFGGGGESLLLNAGQMDRRSRTWWRVILDQFGAADVIYPIVRLERQYPGGPVIGKFAARYGPENRFLGSFTLRAQNSEGIPAMMAEGARKTDELLQQAFAAGRLRAEASLLLEEIDEEDLEELEEEAEVAAEEEKDPLAAAVDSVSGRAEGEQGDRPNPATPAQQVTVNVQVSTPTPEAVDKAEASLRGIPGVRSVSTTSLALGGTSVMRVTFQGDPAALNAALQARGFR